MKTRLLVSYLQSFNLIKYVECDTSYYDYNNNNNVKVQMFQ